MTVTTAFGVCTSRGPMPGWRFAASTWANPAMTVRPGVGSVTESDPSTSRAESGASSRELWSQSTTVTRPSASVRSTSPDRSVVSFVTDRASWPGL